jgi:histidyl-tRNA synthetase
MINASLPKGTRDFSPTEVYKREYIFDTLKRVFRKFGFQPIETPSMENLTTLLGKYGEEGDKLVFKILNSGDYLSDLSNEELQGKNSKKLITKLSEKGLRYDLTVPFARYVVQHKNDIVFPFKRYQIQPVWRADRPQKGRYREFYQCDVDVIGSASLLYDVELIQIAQEVFQKLDIDVTIKINNRKLLYGITEGLGISDKFQSFVGSLDKIDKIGFEGVKQELLNNQIHFDPEEIFGNKTETSVEKIERFRTIFSNQYKSVTGLKGVEELATVFEHFRSAELPVNNLVFDPALARGLNYYTGCIFEVMANKVAMGSICGGGRYDDLTGIFGLKDVSGTGISFGAERILDVLNETGYFEKMTFPGTTKVLFINFGAEEEKYCLKRLSEVRQAGISAEIYPESAKLNKQMNYANQKGIPFVILIGSEEMKTGILTLKNMLSGEQKKIDFDATLQELKAVI